MNSAKPVVVIAGPTAVGKTTVSLELAKMLSTEIINADSMQIYRGMDIGTAKLKPEDRFGVRHHLIDILDVDQTANVSDYQDMGRAVIQDMRSRNLIPLAVGGSGLYLTALLDDLNFPPTDAQVRATLEAQLDEFGPNYLHNRLSGLDPQSAQRIGSTNGRRIVRALEVIELTGEPFTSALPKSNPVITPDIRIALFRNRAELDVRIEERVNQMWNLGFVQEVRDLIDLGLERGVTARKALGYAQIIEALNGDISLDAAKAETIRLTKRYARKQESWFRRDPKMIWMAADEPDLASRILEMIEKGGAGNDDSIH